MSEITEAEVVENRALALRPVEQISPTGLFGTVEPVAVIEKASAVASALKGVIARQGLISKISGKEYPRCEAWTLLGTMLGVFPVLCWSRPVEDGWEARVEAKTRNGDTIGAAEAQCLRGEKNWANRDDFALRSMAQTRATAKCLRMPLGFVMTLAGYEATPAEEMTQETRQAVPQRAASTPPPSTQHRAVATPPACSTVPFPTPESRQKMIAGLKSEPGQPNREIVSEYFRKIESGQQLGEKQELENLALQFVPATTGQMKALSEKLAEFGAGERATAAFPPHSNSEHSEGLVDRAAMEQIKGVIQHVSQKQGSSDKGPWVLYGIKIEDGWINTFSDRVGTFAQQNVGKQVVVWFRTDSKGRTAYDMDTA